MTAEAAAPGLQSDPAKGLTLGFVGGLTLSFDIPLIRLALSDPFTVMAARGFGLALVLFAIWHLWWKKSSPDADLLSDRDFLTVGTLSGLNNICFTLAVFNTSTANVVFILAFNAMLAALLSWFWMRERLGWHTWMAIFATIIGVAIIVSDSVSAGNWKGDVMALACAALLALSLTLTRKSGKDLSMAPGFGGMVSGLFALPMVIVMAPLPEAPIWLALDALVLVPIAGITLWMAPRFIPAPHVALFYLLETVLAPLWVWFVFTEVPSGRAFFGGAIVIGALIVHTTVELRAGRLRRFAANPLTGTANHAHN
ncbi:DMT family transporter [Pseudahrensia aquimaris]|uniref:DMT family transporter n=1 Tax=Pseudahrensia aquimaris TaxID=744461 RepID=A0ABW3FAZ2_9HYPH